MEFDDDSALLDNIDDVGMSTAPIANSSPSFQYALSAGEGIIETIAECSYSRFQRNEFENIQCLEGRNQMLQFRIKNLEKENARLLSQNISSQQQFTKTLNDEVAQRKRREQELLDTLASQNQDNVIRNFRDRLNVQAFHANGGLTDQNAPSDKYSSGNEKAPIHLKKAVVPARRSVNFPRNLHEAENLRDVFKHPKRLSLCNSQITFAAFPSQANCTFSQIVSSVETSNEQEQPPNEECIKPAEHNDPSAGFARNCDYDLTPFWSENSIFLSLWMICSKIDNAEFWGSDPFTSLKKAAGIKSGPRVIDLMREERSKLT